MGRGLRAFEPSGGCIVQDSHLIDDMKGGNPAAVFEAAGEYHAPNG